MQMSSESKSKSRGLGAFVLEKIKRTVFSLSWFCLKVSLSLSCQLVEPGRVLKNPLNDQTGHQGDKWDERKRGDQLPGNMKELNGR